MDLNKGKQPCKGDRIADLITYLQQFPQDWCISIGDYKGVAREEFFLQDDQIATVLYSRGNEVQF